MENCKKLYACLCCESFNLRTILDLGTQSPANNYNVTEKFPLQLNICLDCSHAQLSHSVNPSILFKDYPYMSGVSKTMLRYYESFAKRVVEKYNPKNVFEIACNDGCQLDEFKKLGVLTYGIDPAENLHTNTIAKGHNVSCNYFPSKTNQTYNGYDLIIAQNVFAHVDNPYEFLEGCRALMTDKSVLIIQTSQANMVKNYQFDTIYHEHISFFNKRSISRLFNRCGLEIVDYHLEESIHGGSDVYELRKLPNISVLDYSDFSNRSYKFAEEFKNKIEELQKEESVICYGAAAKMINLIRFTGIKPDAIIDDTPTKQGKVIEGVKIMTSEQLANAEGSFIIPVWNFYDEIKAKIEKEYPSKFRFIKYIPEIIIE